MTRPPATNRPTPAIPKQPLPNSSTHQPLPPQNDTATHPVAHGRGSQPPLSSHGSRRYVAVPHAGEPASEPARPQTVGPRRPTWEETQGTPRPGQHFHPQATTQRDIAPNMDTAQAEMASRLAGLGLRQKPEYTTGQTARILRTSRETVRQMILRWEPPETPGRHPASLFAYRLGSHRRVPHTALVEWFANNTAYLRDQNT